MLKLTDKIFHKIVSESIINKKRLHPKIKSAINDLLHEIGTKYHPKIPLADIFEILKMFGIVLLQEDNTPWSGILMGRDERITINIAPVESQETKDDIRFFKPFENSMLVLAWHKMDQTGNYEVNAYLS